MRYTERQTITLDKIGSMDSFCQINPEKNHGLDFKNNSAWIDYTGEACIIVKGIRHEEKTNTGRHVAFILSMSEAFPGMKSYLSKLSPGLFSLYTLPKAYRVESQTTEESPAQKPRSTKTRISSRTMKMLFQFSNTTQKYYISQDYSKLSTPELVPEFKAFIEKKDFPIDSICSCLSEAITTLVSKNHVGQVDNITYKLAVPAIEENLLFGKLTETDLKRIKVDDMDVRTRMLLQTSKIQGLIVREAFWRMNKELGFIEIPYKMFGKNTEPEKALPKYLFFNAPLADLHGIYNISEFNPEPINSSSIFKPHVNGGEEQK